MPPEDVRATSCVDGTCTARGPHPRESFLQEGAGSSVCDSFSLADGGNKSSCFHLLPTFKLSLAEDDRDGILGPVGSQNHVWTGAVAMGMGGVMGFGCHFRGRPAASGYGFHIRKEILARCCRA